jgi:hypothetical protein
MGKIHGAGRRRVFRIVAGVKLWESGKLQEDLFNGKIESYTNLYEGQ